MTPYSLYIFQSLGAMTSKIDLEKDVMYTLGAWFLCTHLGQGKR